MSGSVTERAEREDGGRWGAAGSRRRATVTSSAVWGLAGSARAAAGQEAWENRAAPAQPRSTPEDPGGKTHAGPGAQLPTFQGRQRPSHVFSAMSVTQTKAAGPQAADSGCPGLRVDGEAKTRHEGDRDLPEGASVLRPGL